MGESTNWIAEITQERERLRGDLERKEREFARIEGEKDALVGRIKALDAVIVMYGGEAAAVHKSNGHGSLADLGLRDAIRNVLAQTGRRLKPAAVVKMLEAGGFQAQEGKTDLKMRVSNELWRMAKRKHLHRSDKGYALKGTPPGALTPEGS
jgi:hypothetical protein